MSLENQLRHLQLDISNFLDHALNFEANTVLIPEGDLIEAQDNAMLRVVERLRKQGWIIAQDGSGHWNFTAPFEAEVRERNAALNREMTGRLLPHELLERAKFKKGMYVWWNNSRCEVEQVHLPTATYDKFAYGLYQVGDNPGYHGRVEEDAITFLCTCECCGVEFASWDKTERVLCAGCDQAVAPSAVDGLQVR